MRMPEMSNLDPAWHRHIEAEILYHYTTWQGLAGILTSGCLWATDVRYLNDTHEFEYGRTLAIDKLTGIRDRLGEPSHVQALSEAIGTLRRLKPRLFAASLAVGGDLLSLWRGYCRPRDGYAIGFSRRGLQKAAKRCGCRLECVIYSPEAQLECLNRVEARAVRRWRAKSNPRGFAKEYLAAFLLLAPFLKSPQFFEEGEWRIVPAMEPRSVRYREARKKRIPFVPVSYLSGRRSPIVEILIGPNPRRSRNEDAVRALCISGGHSVPLHASAVPYR